MTSISPYRGLMAGTIAGLLLWFNPAIIWNAHVYPQWDAWLFPAYLFGAYFALRDWWLPAGILVGLAGMAKGQILLVAPALAVWPLIAERPGWILSCVLTAAGALLLRSMAPELIGPGLLGTVTLVGCGVVAWAAVVCGVVVMVLTGHWTALVRMGVGFALGVGLAVWPWLVPEREPGAQLWVRRAIIGAIVLLPLFFVRGWRGPRLHWAIGLAGFALLLIAWPWGVTGNAWQALWLQLPLFFVLVLAARFLPRTYIPTYLAVAGAAGVWNCMRLFTVSTAWYTVGLEYATRHWKRLYWSMGESLGTILQESYGWQYGPPRNVTQITDAIRRTYMVDLANYIPWLTESWLVPVRQVLIACYIGALVLCAFGIARHARRHDPRLVLALAAPWVLMFALLPQMIDRYLVWAVAVMAGAAMLSAPGAILYVVLTLINWALMLHYQLTLPLGNTSPRRVFWLPILRGTHPGIAWAILVIAGIFLYLALAPSRRVPRPAPAAAPPPDGADEAAAATAVVPEPVAAAYAGGEVRMMNAE